MATELLALSGETGNSGCPINRTTSSRERRWLRSWKCAGQTTHPADFRQALTAAIECGGDTDTVGAILGALGGTTTGKNGIPSEWLDGFLEWPRSRKFMERVAVRLAEQKTSNAPLGCVPFFWPGLIPRNLLFLAVVLAHGFRRLAPPY